MRNILRLFLVLAVLGLGSGEEGARLLASKSLLNRYAVEGRDLTLQYNIYNVGSRSVSVIEHNFNYVRIHRAALSRILF